MSVIKGYRAEKGLSRRELSNILGVDRTTIYNWEVGNTRHMKREAYDRWIKLTDGLDPGLAPTDRGPRTIGPGN